QGFSTSPYYLQGMAIWAQTFVIFYKMIRVAAPHSAYLADTPGKEDDITEGVSPLMLYGNSID
ncbi:hypothetical protein STEG23_024888, partial [Scotinomys teguina]